jgi:hypothetical protein
MVLARKMASESTYTRTRQSRAIHLVMDNLNIHRKKSLTDHLGPAQADYLWNRLRVHYTPKHGSWLNQAKIELRLISRQFLGKRRIPTIEGLQAETRACSQRADHQRLRIQWNFKQKNARQKFVYVKAKNVSMRSKTWIGRAMGDCLSENNQTTTVLKTTGTNFYELTGPLGPPPKVVWLRRCTHPTRDAKYVLRRDAMWIIEFAADSALGILLPDRQ